MWFPDFSYYNSNINIWEKSERMHTGFIECLEGIWFNLLLFHKIWKDISKQLQEKKIGSFQLKVFIAV